MIHKSKIKFNEIPIYVDEHIEDDKILVTRKQGEGIVAIIVSHKINEMLISENRNKSIEDILGL